MTKAISLALPSVTIIKVKKRSRALRRPQSKFGCYTCKERRVRCDESKPACQRCERAGRSCEGYPEPRASDDRTATIRKPSVTPAVSQILEPYENPNTDHIRERCLESLDSSSKPLPGSAALREVLSLGQNYSPSTLVALHALESLHGLSFKSPAANEHRDTTYIDGLYGQVISLISAEISDSRSSPVSVFTTTLLLLAIELIQRRRLNGLTHGIASSQALSQSYGLHGSRSVAHLHRIQGLQCILYSEGIRQSPWESTEPLLFSAEERPTLEEVEYRIIESLHHAQAHIAQVEQDSVLNATLTNTLLTSSCILSISNWYEWLRQHIQATDNAPYGPMFLILMNFLIMTNVQLSCLDAQSEVQWDAHRKAYETILDNTDAIQRDRAAVTTEARHSFTLHMGIIPPLHLIGLKCRHLGLRRRAIKHLKRAGCEGPFIGVQIAAMAERCMQFEGQGEADNAATSFAAIPTSSGLPEEQVRLASCTLQDYNGDTNVASFPSMLHGETTIRLLKRKRPARVARARMLTSTSFRTTPEFSHLQGEELDTDVWEYWTEAIRYGQSVV